MAVLPFRRHEYRIVVLILTTIGLSLLLANVLTFSFTILCMTAVGHRWSDFSLNFGTDIFHSVDFDPRYRPSADDEDADRPAVALPNFDVPGIRSPASGYNWQSYALARANFPLFIRYLQRAAKETSWREARRAGRVYDARAVDFRRFLNGFGLLDYDANIVRAASVYVLHRVRSIQQSIDLVDARGRRLPRWTEHTQPSDVELHNITWNGVVSGRVRVVDRPAEHRFSRVEWAALLALPATGALLTIYFVYRGVQRCGIRKMVLVASAISALATAAAPPAAKLSFWLLALARCAQGVAFGSSFVALAVVAHRWSRREERGLFAGVLSGSIFVAPLITMPMAGWACAEWENWSLVCYVHATVTAIFAALWWLGYRDAPVEHPLVTIHEQRRIESGKVVDARAKHSAVPAAHIRRHPAALAAAIAAFGSCGATLVLIVLAPTFLHKTLNHSLLNTGLLCAAAAGIGFLLNLSSIFVSDRLLIKRFDATRRTRLFAILAASGQTLALVLLAVRALGPDVMWTTGLYAIAIAMHGFNAAGIYKSLCVIVADYTAFFNAHVQALVSLFVLLGVSIAIVITSNNMFEEWSIVFGVLAGLIVFTTVWFGARGSGESELVTERDQERLQQSGAMTPPPRATVTLA